MTLAVAALFAAALTLLNQSKYQGEKHHDTIYLSIKSEPVCITNKESVSGEKRDKEKMNKIIAENSKLTFDAPQSGVFEAESIRVLDDKGRVVIMDLEEYVFGCVLAEMPLDFHPQALMAQCVAARTYAVRNAVCGNNKHKNADVCTDSGCCQSFAHQKDKGYSKEYTQKLASAVSATKGIIALYDGQPINAVYHASSGYNTLDSEQVWENSVDYLKSVKAPAGEEELSKKKYVYTHKSFLRLLGIDQDLEYENMSVQTFGTDEKDGQKVFCACDRQYTEKEICSILGLGVCDIDIETDNSAVTVYSYGYGHRVGMSQHGANLLAKEGFGYCDILKYYYDGISFGFVL